MKILIPFILYASVSMAQDFSEHTENPRPVLKPAAVVSAEQREVQRLRLALSEAQNQLRQLQSDAANKKCDTRIVRDNPKNHVFGIAGIGPDGHKLELKSDGLHVLQNYAPTLGVGYDYNIQDAWTAGAITTFGAEKRSLQGLFTLGYLF